MEESYTFYHSNGKVKLNRGVALVCSKRANAALIGPPKAISPRLMSATFASKPVNMKIIAAYAPHDGKSDEKKDKFYDALEREILATKKSEALYLLGDLNARLGQERDGFERVMGPHNVCGGASRRDR